jgi:thiol-disulfide isomerase/thioredoxin
MVVALLALRLGLAAVFAVAGAAKLADRDGARKAALDFGAPKALAGPLAVALPIAELAVAVLLLPAGTVRWGALGALALLTTFSGAIGLALARGRAPDCHCFGQLHSEPAGWKALVRNSLLAALAAFVAVAGWSDPGPGALAWVANLGGVEVLTVVLGAVALIVVAVGGWALLNVTRGYGRVLVRLERVERVLADAGLVVDEPQEELPEIGRVPGTLAPAFALRNVLGDTVTLEGLLEPGRPLLLLFTSTACGPCAALMPTVAAWQREHAEALTIALVSAGEEEAIRAEAEQRALARVLIDEDLAVYGDYEANGTPSAVLVSPEGKIASWVASGTDSIERIVGHAAAEPAEDEAAFEEGLPVGEPAPQLALPDLEGRRVELAELRGTDIALLFWNPDCGYCRSMHEDVLAWEDDPPAGAPALVVVSSGEAEATAAEGFVSRVLLDSEFEAGGAFGAGGTPMAVRIDAHGSVASPLAAGADAVFVLLGAGR